MTLLVRARALPIDRRRLSRSRARGRVEVARKPTYYLVNVLFPMASFVLMGCCQFAHAVDNVEGRLEYMGAIVLTCCAYKLAISNSTPAVGYVTLLDTYVLSCMAICILLVFEAALVREHYLDQVCFWVALAIFGGLQLALLHQVCCAIPRRVLNQRQQSSSAEREASRLWRERVNPGLVVASNTEDGPAKEGPTTDVDAKQYGNESVVALSHNGASFRHEGSVFEGDSVQNGSVQGGSGRAAEIAESPDPLERSRAMQIALESPRGAPSYPHTPRAHCATLPLTPRDHATAGRRQADERIPLGSPAAPRRYRDELQTGSLAAQRRFHDELIALGAPRLPAPRAHNARADHALLALRSTELAPTPAGSALHRTVGARSGTGGTSAAQLELQ